MVIALFNFYNAFVDLHGVDELSDEEYGVGNAPVDRRIHSVAYRVVGRRLEEGQ